MYQALYRKYRPDCFSDVVGQTHITETLLGELAQGKIFHAYLFTGTRGTGKTSCAKILSKAVNCEHPVNGDPCGQCASCKAIANGEVMDIVEIDAASNNGVDDVRLLREQALFTPAQAKYRVYIIDEVHMLSKPAFNALLKTLEEPPAHVIFILATTEVQELPATILSRCQRFDFSRIDVEVIKNRLLYVAKCEGIVLADAAASLIAALSDGCMRDALSLLDLCAGAGEDISEQTVEKAGGLTGRERINQLVSYINANDSGAALQLMDTLYSASVDVKRLCNDLISHFRDLMVLKSVKEDRKLVVCSDVQYKALKGQAESFALKDIIACLDVLQATLPRLKGATVRCEMEMALVKLCTPELRNEIAALETRVAMLENGVVNTKPMPAQKQAVAPAKEMPAPPKAPPKAPAGTEAPGAVEDLVPPPEYSGMEAGDIPPWEEQPPVDVKEKPAEPQKQTNPKAAEPPAEKPVDTEAAGDGAFSWNAVLAQLVKTSPVLFGLLNGSNAEIRGETVAIYTENAGFWDFLQGNTDNVNRLVNAIAAVTGRKLTPVKAQKIETPQTDPLQAFGKRLKALSNKEEE